MILTSKNEPVINGWLSPTGEFLHCNLYEHYTCTAAYEDKVRDQYLRIDAGSGGESSFVSIKCGYLTVKQTAWIISHIKYFNNNQVEDLINYGLVID
ncbi:hypothetical protein HB665_15725 [Bacillus paranthracis]|uniref:hypothetical protein n=1 Tax=Bacillus cereus group TaxID=86661 RepID=UPI001443F073|nr:hypothetical protein [Bacillus paranthracis]NKX25617.1 hypothetical protein [Bacillus paranthracis]